MMNVSKEDYKKLADDRHGNDVKSRMGSIYATFDFYELLALGNEKKSRGFHMMDMDGIVEGIRLFLDES